MESATERVQGRSSPKKRAEVESGVAFDWRRPVEILVLSSFAFSQPLFALFAPNATFLLAHELEGATLIGYALALILIPAGALLVVELIGHKIGPEAGRITHLTILGLLLGLSLGPPLNRAIGSEGAVSILILLAAAAAGIALFLRFQLPRRVVRYGWFAPPVFLGLFLFASPASSLLDPVGPQSQAVVRGDDIPVVWLVFDQFPLAIMVDDEGRLVDERYPEFARLAATSTWYSRATTVAGDTHLAVPAALSGTYPGADVLPLAAQFPINAFTLLAGSHQVMADENVTQLCPRSICLDDGTGVQASLYRDTITVLTRVLLTDSLADHVVPELNDRWAGFGADPDSGSDQPARDSGDDRFRMEAFLAGIDGSTPGAFHYLHLEKPHEPLMFLPDGRMYDYCSCYYTTPEGRWPDDPVMLDQRMQTYLMQAMYADRELGRVLDRLEEASLLEESLLVVMSDHGASLLPGNLNRRLDPGTYPDVLPVPLFVKLPGQTTGSIDPRNAQLIDILPTVVDVLEIDLEENPFAGTSLLTPPGDEDPVTVITPDGVEILDPPPVVTDSPMIDRIAALFPDPADPFRFGPNASLLGHRVEELLIGESDLSVEVVNRGSFDKVDLGSDRVPAHVIGELTGADSPTQLAVSFNGIIAGVGSSYWNDLWRVSIVGDPRYLVDGRNELGVYQIDRSGLLLIQSD